MPKIPYIIKRFNVGSLAIIEHANRIIEDYASQGLILTLRQIFYRFVATGLLPNLQKEYKRLGSVINDGRLAGKIDWDAIEDRGRNLIDRPHWSSPANIIRAAAQSYAIDKWEGQENYVEVWVEKQALESVIDRACEPLDVNCYACKGYTSQSEMWRAAMRFREQRVDDRNCVIIHLGDHDPSGLDMTRDIRDRLNDVFRIDVEVKRIALNMDQVTAHAPPPNPTKLTDSRAEGYIARYGDESWELDALDPATLNELIQDAIREYLDQDLFDERVDQEEDERREIMTISTSWSDISEGLKEEKEEEED